MANKWPFVKRRHRVVPPVGPLQLLLLLLLMQCAPSVLSTLFHCINGTRTSLVTSTRRRNSFCRFHKLKRICINPNQLGNWFFSPLSPFFLLNLISKRFDKWSTDLTMVHHDILWGLKPSLGILDRCSLMPFSPLIFSVSSFDISMKRQKEGNGSVREEEKRWNLGWKLL